MAATGLCVGHVRFCWQAQHLVRSGVGVGEPVLEQKKRKEARRKKAPVTLELFYKHL